MPVFQPVVSPIAVAPVLPVRILESAGHAEASRADAAETVRSASLRRGVAAPGGRRAVSRARAMAARGDGRRLRAGSCDRDRLLDVTRLASRRHAAPRRV